MKPEGQLAATALGIGLLLMTAATACSNRAPTPPGDAPGDSTGGAGHQGPATLQVARDDDAERGSFLFAGLEDGFDELGDPTKVYPWRMSAGGLEQGPLLTLPRPPVPESGYPVAPALAAARGRDLYVSQGAELFRFRPFDGPDALASVAVPQPPTALYATGDHCLVGSAGRVDRADFSGTPPAVTALHRSERVNKPIDFFVALPGDRLVAVDDVVRPKFALVFDQARAGTPRYRFTAALPAGANESYVSAAAAGDVLAIAATFGVMFGTGNNLYRCRFRGERPDCSTLTESRPGHGYAPPTAADRASPDNRLLAGDELTYWTSVGAVDDQLFLCAGARGVLHLPVDGTDARMVDVGGECLGLLAQQDQIAVLVRRPPPDSAPVELAARVASLEVVTAPAVGTRCSLALSMPDAQGSCTARVVCGGANVFGGEAGSPVPCTRDHRGALTIEDMEFSSSDGDPILRLYGGYGQATIRDLTGAGDTYVMLDVLGPVDAAPRELAILRWDGKSGALRELSRHPLPGAPGRLAR